MRTARPQFRKTPLVLALTAALALPVSIYAAPGDPVGGEFRVNTTTVNNEFLPSVGIDSDGDYLIAWTSSNGDDRDIFAQRYNRLGAAQGGEFQVNFTTFSDQNYPSVSRDADGDTVIAWESFDQEDGYGIYAQRFNNAGARVGVEFRVNTTTFQDQRDPTVSLETNGDAIIAWQSDGQDGSGYGIYAQRYNNLGAPIGGEFRVNSTTLGNQGSPAISLDADGDAVITWQSHGQDGSDFGIYAQRFNNTGAPVGGEFRVNSSTLGSQSFPSVSRDADGDTVIAWQSGGQDGSGYGIYAQRFNNAGVPNGGEFRVNTITTNNQSSPAVALDADGDVVITWDSFGASTYDIRAQRYNNAGVPIGGEFGVNTTSADNQAVPAIALDADGDAVIAWQSRGQDGGAYGIYAQRYAGAGTAKIETCGGLAATITGTAGPDILTGTAGNDVIQALEGNDTVNGLGGNDLLCGGIGDDRILGGSGNDLIRGGDGIDTAVFGGASGVTANLTTGTATGEGSDTLELMENITGTSAADTLTGDALNNVLTGGPGNDRLNGAGGIDTASFAGTAAVTVNLGTGTSTGQGSDTLSNLENLIGSNGNDRLTGNNANNTLVGGSGNDIIQGVGGNDRLFGGSGNDSLNGGTGTDNCDGQTGTDTAGACETVVGVP